MKLILFQLITNFTIGSIVYFDKGVHKIVDVTLIHPFIKRTKGSLFKSKWNRPFWFVITLVNPYGGINIVGRKAIKDIFSAGYSYNEIIKSFKYGN